MILLAVVLGVTVVGATYSHFERLRRTGDVDVTIDARAFQPGSGPLPDTPQGHWLRYSYSVGNLRFDGSTFRRWNDVERYDAKVCYDPNDPSDHMLVAGWVQCGG